MYSSGPVVVVAFRGTYDLVNWIYDLTFRKVAPYPRCEGCLVHAGFVEAWESVHGVIARAVKEHLRRDPNAEVCRTGRPALREQPRPLGPPKTL